MISLYSEKKDCYGCTACKNICPRQAITMDFDQEGFLYPIIDESKCVECGLCNSVCPYKNDIILKGYIDTPIVYALKHSNISVRMSSSSGGAYTAISDSVIKKNGICYGAAFDDTFCVKHKSAVNDDERDRLKGSKYVQSDLRSCYSKVRQDLLEGNTVLFTGTPCQTAGLVQYLIVAGADMSNLIVIDIICHGTPSPGLWKNYVELIENKYKAKLAGFTFRCKEIGWRGYNVRAKFSNGLVIINSKNLAYHTNLFRSDLCLRPSCYCCKYASVNRISDITIGDFWGIEKCMPDFADDKGVSLVLVNTVKGESLFNEIKDDVVYIRSNLLDCMQLNLYQPTRKPPNREVFWEDYYKHGYSYVATKYSKHGLKKKIKKYLMVIKNFTKKLLNK